MQVNHHSAKWLNFKADDRAYCQNIIIIIIIINTINYYYTY